jgi:hypothetical protein
VTSNEGLLFVCVGWVRGGILKHQDHLCEMQPSESAVIFAGCCYVICHSKIIVMASDRNRKRAVQDGNEQCRTRQGRDYRAVHVRPERYKAV